MSSMPRAAQTAVVNVEAPARLGTTRLPGGRRLAWSEWGPASGAPVLLCPGAATSRRLGFGLDALEALGVRLISVDRPGLGASDPAPGRTLTDWAQDIRHFAALRELDGGALRAVGFSQGGPFALALAADGIVARLAVVSGTDEIALPAFDALLPEEVRFLTGRAAADPAAAERSFAGFGSPEALYEMIAHGSGEIDLAVLQQPLFTEAFRQAMAEAFAQGPDGYARDTLLAMSRWPFDLGRITAPVDLWYGAQDTNPTHSPDHGERLAARIPTARRHLVAEAGGNLLWTHAERILRALLDG